MSQHIFLETKERNKSNGKLKTNQNYSNQKTKGNVSNYKIEVAYLEHTCFLIIIYHNVT